MPLKQQIKRFLIRKAPWYPALRASTDSRVHQWISSGCSGVAPHQIKMDVILANIRKFEIKKFIETGTFKGQTLSYIAQTGIDCTSIELSEQLYAEALTNFHSYKNVALIQGDSGIKLPELLNSVFEPSCFWLDGHYSAGITARGELDTPISAELEAILTHPIKRHVILIDDARCFDGTNSYPHLDEILRVIRKDEHYRAEVSTDIIRIVPR